MKTTELRKKPLAELMALHRKIGVAIKAKQVQMKKARERVVALADKLGVSVRELASLVSKRGPDKVPRKARAAKVALRRGTPMGPRKPNGSAESRVTH